VQVSSQLTKQARRFALIAAAATVALAAAAHSPGEREPNPYEWADAGREGDGGMAIGLLSLGALLIGLLVMRSKK
jgi:hypothetical protein